MRQILTTILLTVLAMTAGAQDGRVLEQLRQNPKRAYGGDFPYQQVSGNQTKAPRGYKPFYISHYGRHGSRYYWTDRLYKELDTLLTAAHNRHQLTPLGETFYGRFVAIRQELLTGATELTQLGWDQHQGIARTMYRSFPEVFRRGGDVLAIASLSGRCVISMAAFCQELVQCNPKIEIREQSSRFTLDGVVPGDRQNPAWREYPRSKPRFEQNRSRFNYGSSLQQTVAARVFVSLDCLHTTAEQAGANLMNLYTSLPSIGREGMMEGIVTDDELVGQWEAANLGGYAWVFEPRYEAIPILKDILSKAADVVDGRTQRLADLRFGHDTYVGPLTVLMGINGADRDPEDPYEVKNCYQNWETCMAANIQLVFYRKRGSADVLVKCLLNGEEATLPVPTTQAPYYRWTDLRDFYQRRCAAAME